MLAPSLASLALLSSAVVVSASSHRAGRFPHKRAADDLARRRDGGSNARSVCPACIFVQSKANLADVRCSCSFSATYYDTSVGPGACGIVRAFSLLFPLTRARAARGREAREQTAAGPKARASAAAAPWSIRR